MAQYVCSLKFDAARDRGPLPVPAGDGYYLVPFPFGSAESVHASESENVPYVSGAAEPQAVDTSTEA